MDCIKEKVQAMKLEKDKALDFALLCQEQARDANSRAEKAEEEVRTFQKKMQTVENELDHTQEQLAQAEDKLEQRDKALHAVKERGPRGVLDPKYNKVFLNVFGAERNKSITMKFITDITGLPIQDIVYVNRYTDSDHDNQAESIVDVRCKTSSGEQFLIEIQKNYQRGFAKRLFFYGAKLFSSQIEPGETDDNPNALKNVVVIGICNGGAIMHNKSHISHHKMLDVDTKQCELDGMAFHFIDLKKFRLKKNEVQKVKNATDAWCFFLKYIHQLDEMELSVFREKNPDMERAINELEKFSLTKEEYETYLLYRMGLSSSLNSTEEYAEDVSKQKVMESKIEIAKKMLASGEPIDKICLFTGLKSEDFVE